MAQIYPRLSESELDQLQSRAEAKVYRWLRELEFDGLEVYFSLATQTRNPAGTWIGEIDFLLFHPQYGIQIWEVKGGGIQMDGQGNWLSKGNQGTHKIGTTPLAQLKKCTNSLVQGVEKALGTAIKLPIAPVLVFPDTHRWEGDFPEVSINHNHFLLAPDFNPLQAEQIIHRFKNTAFAGPRADNCLPLTSQQAALIRNRLLRPSCALVSNAADDALALEAELFRLSHEQQWVLRLLEHIPRMAIYGGAGTGKSVLARLRAQEQAREGKKVLLLCFNILLAEAHRKELGSDPADENIEVATFHQLCQSRAEQAGLNWALPENPKEVASFYNETAPNLLSEALEKNPENWDALVVDEAQDYEPYWWLVVSELLKEDASITLVADPEQNLFGRDFALPLDVFDGLVPYPFKLHQNYRNAFEIATWLKDKHKQAAEPGNHLPSSNRPVQIFTWKKPEQQLEHLKEQIQKLEEEGFKPEDLLLLTPFKVENSHTLQSFLQDKPQYLSRVSNISAAKGLEARAVLLLDIGASEWASKPQVEYVGASRARVVLKIFKKSS
ncbi:Nuclease-related domain-containing protein [Marinospirillum celere]|uniref:DNA 3'-5' helicase II n=1 Tax=Marinospirillum celere TaxID=1122252 RepID=A0A1I1EJB4_9GAMM|nr:nuclease-related domain-containing DEAD/DEAH box helicase [Marinospirillum celere]SFB87141.1 Nuclease-related domain-containing protein [Marinospirillum celere]